MRILLEGLGFGYNTIGSPYTRYFIYLRGTIDLHKLSQSIQKYERYSNQHDYNYGSKILEMETLNPQP